MILVFVDECGDAKYQDYLGLSLSIINSTYYSHIKNQFKKILIAAKWDITKEFKGSYLFSASKGCAEVTIDERIEIATKILKLNVAKKNARMKFSYLTMNSSNQKSDYLKYLPALLNSVLSRATKGSGKDIISVFCDSRSDIKPIEIQKAISPILTAKKYTLLEQVVMANSDIDTIGILYADLVGYLSARIDTISNDIELFENISEEDLANNGKIKKLKSSKVLIDIIKQYSAYEVKAESET
ncbi:MAG: DUF3800 domain-containing protein [Bacteroidetes bacterium]|nr:DUF3800 domain-containing protein [Bacteroidota bacterium]